MPSSEGNKNKHQKLIKDIEEWGGGGRMQKIVWEKILHRKMERNLAVVKSVSFTENLRSQCTNKKELFTVETEVTKN